MNEPLKLKPYPNYRPSGVKWFDRLPTHWEVRRLRNVADLRVSSVDKHKREDEEHVRLCNYVDVYNNDRITVTMNFMHATAAPDEIERFRLERGDVLITKDSETWDDIGIPALVTDSAPDLISGYHLALLRPRSEHAVGGYLFRALESKGISRQFHVQARGVTRFGLTHVGIKSVWLPVPPLSEQVRIVRFLDHVDRRIQRYIRAKQKLIALLEEQKQAIIHQAVTGQIDVRTGYEYPAYKPSGIEWVGDVPKHWSLVPNKVLLREKKTLVGERYTDYELLSLTKNGVIIRDVSSGRGKFSADMRTFQEVSPGDLVFCLFDVPETPRTVGLSHHEGMITGAYTIFESRDQVLGSFMEAFYIAIDDRKMLSPIYSGLRNTISPSRFLGIKTAIPPKDEQAAILDFLVLARTHIDDAMAISRRQIDLLNEWSTCIIADVVTGKVDVGQAVASLRADDAIGGVDTADDSMSAGEKSEATIEEERA